MKFKAILFTILIILLLGCSDDDCPVCPNDSNQQIIITGTAHIYGSNLRITLEATEFDGKPIAIDSVKADSTTLTGPLHFWTAQNIYSFKDDSNIYHGGEIVNFEIYAKNDVGNVSIHMYNDSDLIEMYNFETIMLVVDTIGFNEPLTLYWNDNLGADFYEIVYQYLYDSSGSFYEQQGKHQTNDTSFLIPTDKSQFEGAYTLMLAAISGPMDDEPGNIIGNTIKGKLISYSSRIIEVVVQDRLSEI